MEICSRAGMKSLFRLFLRAWPKISAFSLGLLKNDHELISPSLMEEATVNKDTLELPVEILSEIFALLEIPDLVRAGCVCSSWHTAYTSLRSSGWYSRQQTPCLLYISESAGDDVACLYSLAEERVYKLTLPKPPIRSRYLIGSSNGWLVTADERSELHIVNPITGEQIALPSVTTIKQVKPIFDDTGAIQEYELSQYFGEVVTKDPFTYALRDLRDNLYVKAFVFSESSTGTNIVVLIHDPFCQLSFARAGDSEWTWLPPSANYEDCLYGNGLLYAVTSTGGIDAFDLTGPSILWKVIMDGLKNYIFESIYIVQTPSGDLLQVWREQDVVPEGDDTDLDSCDMVKKTNKIMIYKVHMATKELVEINSLQGHALFLGHSLAHCLPVEEYPQLKSNHVYLTDNDRAIMVWKSDRRDICVFNLESNIREEIVPPHLCSWPAPIWITPTLTKLNSAFKN
ncbi:hypothetical protein EJB05_27420, partial [Eragrostis curvula]